MPNTTPGASALSVFTFRTTEVRTVEKDGLIWFVASDIAKALNYLEAKDLTRILEDDEKGRQIVPTPSGDQEMTVINESGMYHAVLKSRKPEAKPFRKWVTSEVLPAIRQTGSYSAASAPAAPKLLTGTTPLDLYFAALRMYAGNYTNKAALWLGLSDLVFNRLGIKCLDGITHANVEEAIRIVREDMTGDQIAMQAGRRYLRN